MNKTFKQKLNSKPIIEPENKLIARKSTQTQKTAKKTHRPTHLIRNSMRKLEKWQYQRKPHYKNFASKEESSKESNKYHQKTNIQIQFEHQWGEI